MSMETVVKGKFYVVTAKTEDNFDIGDLVEASATAEEDGEETDIPEGMFYAVCANDDGDWLASGYLDCSSVSPVPTSQP